MAYCRHYTKVVVPLQSPVIDSRMPDVVKEEILYPDPPAGCRKIRFNRSGSQPRLNKTLIFWQVMGLG
jgi:hypothetical protein